MVEVRSEAPFLPKVAFLTITIASLAGAVFTGRSLGVSNGMLGPRWFALWTIALALGFTAWRVFYLRRTEPGLNTDRMNALVETSLSNANTIGKPLAVGVAVSALVPFFLSYPSVTESWVIGSFTIATAMLLWMGLDRSDVAIAAFLAALGTSVAWGIASTGFGFYGAVRVLHLTAFGLWLGGALWNLTVAIPSGREHPVIDAVVGGARHLQRFRWVVRFALPTVVLTGLVQADVYRELEASWWIGFPGILIPVKLALIVVLIVIFITCPLYRQCSPVTGVCRIDDINREPV